MTSQTTPLGMPKWHAKRAKPHPTSGYGGPQDLGPRGCIGSLPWTAMKTAGAWAPPTH